MKILIWVVALFGLVSCATASEKNTTVGQQKDDPSEKLLPVAFKCQVPPGDKGKTKNCGPASALMVISYHRKTAPTEGGIREMDEWLFAKYGDPVNNYNGSGTNPEKLEALVKEYGGFPSSYKAKGWGLGELREQIDRGLPVIASVTARYLSNRGYKYAWEHFLVVIGYTENSVICHDPARPDSSERHFSNADFAKALSSRGGAVVVVVPNRPKSP